MRILLIEDDLSIASFITKGLKQEGYSIVHCGDGISGFELALDGNFELAIIDIMLPGLDGYSIIEKLRNKNNHIPIIIVSARRTVDERVKGLMTGADDYLVKPFAFSELAARVQAILRRRQPVEEVSVLSYSDLTIDIRKRKVSRGGRDIDLQPREFALLEYLLRHQGRIISRTMLMEHVWDYNFDPQTNVVEARICNLRDKIDKPYKNKLIHTVKGVGYVLEERQYIL
ncbi:MAG TPA: response regulator transcription factor [Bacteroidales bacterium]|nr:response regulator transcription factor [Bacteroidales bacterium]